MKRLVPLAAASIYLIVCSALGYQPTRLASSWDNTSQNKTPVSEKTPAFWGICYGPFSGMQNPACGPYPTAAEMKKDLAQMARYTKRIRIYSTSGTLGQIPKLAHDLGIECTAGCWISKEPSLNEAEITALIKAVRGGFVKRVVVGNEVLLRGDLPVEKLISYIRRVRRETGVKVGYADVWSVWKKHPELAREVDFILVHIYAFWDGVPIDQAAQYTIARYEELKKLFPDKEVIIGEVGWPKKGSTLGKAVPSIDNHRRFIKDFTSLASKRNIPYYLFEAFDEQWKATQEGDFGAHWGTYLLKKDATLRQPVVTQFPFAVYDEFSPTNHFVPSGWMGDINSITFDPACKEDPLQGSTCIKIRYQPGLSFLSQGWAGIYWQYPENNWGDLPGYHFRGVKRLTFWARGEKGGEESEFKVGGIDSPDKPYRDSLPLQTTGVVKLTKEWKKYTIPIPYSNLPCVISGFCWVTNIVQNPNGCTIYLDNIQFE